MDDVRLARDLDIGQECSLHCNIMGPAMISQLLPPASSMFATKLLAGYGTAAVAAWALSRFEFFLIVAVLALTMSMLWWLGACWERTTFENIRKLVKIARCLYCFRVGDCTGDLVILWRTGKPNDQWKRSLNDFETTTYWSCLSA